MAKPKISQKKRIQQAAAAIRKTGVTDDAQIVRALALSGDDDEQSAFAEYSPRQLFRHMNGLGVDDVAALINKTRKKDGPKVAPSRVSEAESWPTGSQRPASYIYVELAEVYGTTPRELFKPEELLKISLADQNHYGLNVVREAPSDDTAPDGSHETTDSSGTRSTPLPQAQVELTRSLATRTFLDMVSGWLGPEMSLAEPESEGRSATILLKLPSLFPGVGLILQKWRIYVDLEPRVTLNTIDLRLSSFEVSSILDQLSIGNLYITVPVPKSGDARPWAIQEAHHLERFDWYALDASQVQGLRRGESAQVSFPRQNKLTLSTFSLLWGSLWTNMYYAPLRHPTLLELSEYGEFRKHLLRPKDDDRLLFSTYASESRAPTIPEGVLPPDEQARMNFVAGTTTSLYLISNELRDRSSMVDSIITYCPESLWGTLNLWLFCRAYHQFMDQSSEVVQDRSKTERLLPIQTGELGLRPLIYYANLWHVFKKYKRLGVNVRFVEPDPVHGGEDHAYYGDVVKYFPWIQIDDNGSAVLLDPSEPGSVTHHLDFLAEAHQRTLIGPDATANSFHDVVGQSLASLEMSSSPPVGLFVRESDLYRHPQELWR